MNKSLAKPHEPARVQRVQTGVRLEKSLLKTLKALAAFYDLSLGEFLELMVLDCFSGRRPFSDDALEVALDGEVYRSVEHAYQAAKTTDRERRKEVHSLTAGGAKRWGSALPLRPDWEAVKLGVMRDLLRQKFLSDRGLAAQLDPCPPRELQSFRISSPESARVAGLLRSRTGDLVGGIVLDESRPMPKLKDGRDQGPEAGLPK